MLKKEDHQRVFSNKQIINIAQELNDKLDLTQYHSEITFTGKRISDFVISRVYHADLFAREMILPHAEAHKTLKRTKQQGWNKIVAAKFLTMAYPLPIGIAKTIVNENW